MKGFNFEATDERKEMKIGAFVRTTFMRLIDTNAISQEMVFFLTDGKYCKNTFDLNYPLLKKVERGISTAVQGKIKGHSRYWVGAITIHGEKYIMCNDWYDRNRTKLIKWIGNVI